MKHCHFCNNNVRYPDYKDVEGLKKFLDPHARLLPKRRSGLCAGHQRKLATAVKRARFLALLPFLSS
ncbi:MAG: 30S ribosomal protein S18 [Candidatus Vogelbacteria bacterium]|nr:30S ribosomal protein S18 [Candidatus Vogelbacteria bacterium]